MFSFLGQNSVGLVSSLLAVATLIAPCFADNITDPLSTFYSVNTSSHHRVFIRIDTDLRDRDPISPHRLGSSHYSESIMSLLDISLSRPTKQVKQDLTYTIIRVTWYGVDSVPVEERTHTTFTHASFKANRIICAMCPDNKWQASFEGLG